MPCSSALSLVLLTTGPEPPELRGPPEPPEPQSEGRATQEPDAEPPTDTAPEPEPATPATTEALEPVPPVGEPVTSDLEPLEPSSLPGRLVEPEEFEQPERRGARELPRVKGIGLLTAASLFGATWIGVKITGTVLDAQQAPDLDDPLNDTCFSWCFYGPALNGAIGSPLLIHAMGFLGGGMHNFGRYQARADRGRPRKHTAAFYMGLGGGLLLGGAAIFGATQYTAAFGVDTNVEYVAVIETGWWTAGLLGQAGAALLGYGHGRRRGERELSQTRAPSVSVIPSFGPHAGSLSVQGQF